VNDGFVANGTDRTTGFPIGRMGLSGTVIRLMFGKDIAVNGSLIPGLLGRSTFIIRARIKNINYHRPIHFDLWVVPVYEGIISFSAGTARKEIAPLTSTELVASAPVSHISFIAYESAFGNGLFDVIGKVAKGVGSVLGLIPTPVTQGISGVVKSVGNMLHKHTDPSTATI